MADYTDTAELYDPVTDAWRTVGVVSAERAGHRVVVLPSGPLLLIGGCNGSCDTSLTTVEQFEPGTTLWTANGALPEGRARHSATLLPSGQVLLAGGSNYTGNLGTAELYDVVPGSLDSRPVVMAPGSGLPGTTLQLAGTGFRGLAGGSGKGTQDSPTDFPLVTLQHLDSQRLTRLAVTAWTATSATAELPRRRPGPVPAVGDGQRPLGGRTFHVGPNVAPVASALAASTDEDFALPLALEAGRYARAVPSLLSAAASPALPGFFPSPVAWRWACWWRAPPSPRGRHVPGRG